MLVYLPLDRETVVFGGVGPSYEVVRTDAHRNGAAQAFVQRLVVVEPGVIQPTYVTRGGLPTALGDNPDQTAPASASRAADNKAGGDETNVRLGCCERGEAPS